MSQFVLRQNAKKLLAYFLSPLLSLHLPTLASVSHPEAVWLISSWLWCAEKEKTAFVADLTVATSVVKRCTLIYFPNVVHFPPSMFIYCAESL